MEAGTATTVPSSVYVHIPFCIHRCGYCNFALVAQRDYLIDRYLDALGKEVTEAISGLSDSGQKVTLKTLYMGGGTPSHLSEIQLDRLGEILGDNFDFRHAEVTAEANPNDLTDSRLTALQRLGVNRISLGVQSLRPEKLRYLERRHNVGQVQEVARRLQRRVPNFSVDLIFATEGETARQWSDDLHAAIELAPSHISTYELTIEKGTRFWNRRFHGNLQVTPEFQRADMYELAIDTLQANGFQHYEISSFAKKENTRRTDVAGYRCRHNLVYWSGQPFLAFGAGAANFIDGVRSTNHRSVSTYIRRVESGQSPIAEREVLTGEESWLERLAIGLRNLDGVNKSEFFEIAPTGLRDRLSERVDRLVELGFLKTDPSGAKIQLTRQGMLLYDSVATELLRLA